MNVGTGPQGVGARHMHTQARPALRASAPLPPQSLLRHPPTPCARAEVVHYLHLVPLSANMQAQQGQGQQCGGAQSARTAAKARGPDCAAPHVRRGHGFPRPDCRARRLGCGLAARAGHRDSTACAPHAEARRPHSRTSRPTTAALASARLLRSLRSMVNARPAPSPSATAAKAAPMAHASRARDWENPAVTGRNRCDAAEGVGGWGRGGRAR